MSDEPSGEVYRNVPRFVSRVSISPYRVANGHLFYWVRPSSGRQKTKKQMNVIKHMNRFTWAFLLLCVGLLSAETSQAQNRQSIGLVGQIGSPSGIGIYAPTQNAYDIDVLAAWDLDEVFFVNGHMIYSSYGQTGNNVRFYYGPGAFLGFREGSTDDNLTLGISGRLGVGVMLQPVELFIHVTPRISLLDTSEGFVGGGIGLRYFL